MKAFSTSGTGLSRYVSSIEPDNNDNGGRSHGMCSHPSTLILLLLLSSSLLLDTDDDASNKLRTKSLASFLLRLVSSPSSPNSQPPTIFPSVSVDDEANDTRNDGVLLLLLFKPLLLFRMKLLRWCW